jgi:hypothetical protein
MANYLINIVQFIKQSIGRSTIHLVEILLPARGEFVRSNGQEFSLRKPIQIFSLSCQKKKKVGRLEVFSHVGRSRSFTESTNEKDQIGRYALDRREKSFIPLAQRFT